MKVNLLPPMSCKKTIFIKDKVVMKSICQLHEWILSNSSNKIKKETNMFSMLKTNSKRYLQTNTLGIWGICIDIDLNSSFDYVKSELDILGLNYLMYSTHSNGKEGQERFRAVIVLNKLYSKDEFIIIKSELKEYFKRFNVDLSTFDINRRFIFPPMSCSFNDNLPPRIESNSEGSLLDLEPFIKLVKTRIKCESRYGEKEFEKTFKKSRKGLINYFKTIKWEDGSKHSVLVSKIIKFKNDGYTFNEIKEVVNETTRFRINWSLYNNLK